MLNPLVLSWAYSSQGEDYSRRCLLTLYMLLLISQLLIFSCLPQTPFTFPYISPHSNLLYVCHLWKEDNHSVAVFTLYGSQWLFLPRKLLKCCHVGTASQGLLQEARAIPHYFVPEEGRRMQLPTSCYRDRVDKQCSRVFRLGTSHPKAWKKFVVKDPQLRSRICLTTGLTLWRPHHPTES